MINKTKLFERKKKNNGKTLRNHVLRNNRFVTAIFWIPKGLKG